MKSLTGKPFDPEEPKTQGIDQSLVNGTWQNFLYLESSVDSLKRFRSVNHFWKGWKCYCSGVHEFNCWVIVPNPAQSGTWPILLFYNVISQGSYPAPRNNSFSFSCFLNFCSTVLSVMCIYFCKIINIRVIIKLFLSMVVVYF